MIDLSIHRIVVRRSDTFTLEVNNLTVPAGETVALVGPNGSGKSTLLHSLIGSVKPADVDARWGTQSVRVDSIDWRKAIGFIADTPSTLGDLTFAEHLLLHDYMYDLEGTDTPEVTLGQFGLGHQVNDLVRSGSFGMTRRLSACLALRHNPSVILADEPFVALDTVSKEQVRTAIKRRLNDGAVCLISSHDVASLQRICDFVVLMINGKIVASTTSRGVDIEEWYLDMLRDRQVGA